MADEISGSSYILVATVAGANFTIDNVAASLGREVTQEEVVEIAKGLAAVPGSEVRLDQVEMTATTSHYNFDTETFE